MNSATFSITFSDRTSNATFTRSGLAEIGGISLNRSLTLTVTGIGSPVATGSANLSGSPLAGLLGITLSDLLSGGGSLNDNPAVGNLNSAAISAPGSLAAMTGSGVIDLTLSGADTYGFSTLVSLSAVTWGGTTEYAGLGIVTYDYTVVPEPSTAAVLIVGIAALAFVRQKKAQPVLAKSRSLVS